ncbi:LysR family transcriptional regulator [Paraburkholderia fungorum]|uniref:LysR family transcriptional regulator n=1 Tax=Paraburkholderia fungorum TaxID=134537 RepID=UPI00402BE2B2
MDRLQAMHVFTRVVQSGSFSRAAETLDIARASVTITIQNLESYLKVRLIQRSTRQFSLTPEGEQFYARCVQLLTDVQELEDSLAHASTNTRGRLRVEMPASIGKTVVIPALDEFKNLYPDIELSIGFGDRPIDLIQEAVDCMIRFGPLSDSNLVAKRVGSIRKVTAATSQYLTRYGVPESIAELSDHICVRYLPAGQLKGPDLSFEVNNRTVCVNLRASVCVNDIEAYLGCGLKGLGIMQVPRFIGLPYLCSGELVNLLPQFAPAPVPVSVVYPHNRHLSKSVRVFVDWIANLFARSALLSTDQPGPDPSQPRAPTAMTFSELTSKGRCGAQQETFEPVNSRAKQLERFAATA